MQILNFQFLGKLHIFLGDGNDKVKVKHTVYSTDIPADPIKDRRRHLNHREILHIFCFILSYPITGAINIHQPHFKIRNLILHCKRTTKTSHVSPLVKTKN